LGARFVIAVDVSARRGTTPAHAPTWKKARDEARWNRIEPEVRHADFLFHPDLDYDAGPWPSYFRMARVRGELHASDRLPALLRALSKA
jgi:NTE family protein